MEINDSDAVLKTETSRIDMSSKMNVFFLFFKSIKKFSYILMRGKLCGSSW